MKVSFRSGVMVSAGLAGTISDKSILIPQRRYFAADFDRQGSLTVSTTSNRSALSEGLIKVSGWGQDHARFGS
jgi:hypothetical protein